MNSFLNFIDTHLKQKTVWLPLAIVVIFIRFYISIFFPIGDGDPYSWKDAADTILHGLNLYTFEHYNYGPLWGYLVAGLRWFEITILKTDHFIIFHLLLTFFLTLIELCFANIIRKRYGLVPAVIFFTAPVVILNAGFQTHHEILALLLGYWGWETLEAIAKDENRSIFRSGKWIFWCSLSLMCKHVLIFLPLWLLFWKRLGPLYYRLFLAGMPYVFFLFSFVPFVDSLETFSKIQDHVFHHTANVPTLLSVISQYMIHPNFMDQVLGWIPVFSGIKFFWLLLILFTGRWAMRHDPEEGFFIYLLSFVLFAPGVWLYHLVIPMAACGLMYRHPGFWIFWLFSSLGEFARLSVSYPFFTPLGIEYRYRALEDILWRQPPSVWISIPQTILHYNVLKAQLGLLWVYGQQVWPMRKPSNLVV